MSIVCLTVKQKNGSLLIIPTSRMQGKIKLLEHQFKCLKLWYFTKSELKTNMDIICQKWDLYQACRVTELHITKEADYTDLFIALKTAASLRSRNNYQFKT